MIADRLAAVWRDVAEACLRAGRDPASVKLVAVSKTMPVEALQAAYDAGQRVFGENYAQELRDKARALPADVQWHFIGRLQANKAKYVAPVASRVHALEGADQAVALADRAAGRTLDVLISVNVGGEETKGGVAPAALPAAVDAIAAVAGIRVVGLMALPPLREDPAEMAPFFAELAALAAAERARGRAELTELSMGTSHDYAVAIAHGATWVRVGTAIFGART